jgi:hypothetical protein
MQKKQIGVEGYARASWGAAVLRPYTISIATHTETMATKWGDGC